MPCFPRNEDERQIEVGMTGRMNSRIDRGRGTHGDVPRPLAVVDGESSGAAIRERFSPLKVHDDWYRVDTTMAEDIGREGHEYP